MAFKIADGYVEVHGRLDDPSFRRAAERAGDRAGHRFATAFGRASMLRFRRMTRLFLEPINAVESALSAIRGPSLRAGILSTILGLVPSAGKAAAALGASLIPALISLGSVVGVVRLMLGKLNEDIKGQTLKLLNSMADRIRELAREAAKPGLNKFMEGVVKNGPMFERYIQRIARAVGDALGEVGDLLSDRGFVGKLGKLLDSVARGTATWTGMLDDVVEMVVTLGAAAGPIFEKIATKVSEVVGRWRDWLNLKYETGELQQFLEEAWEELQRWGRIFANVVIGLYNIFAAGVGPSSKFAESLERITGSFRKWTEESENVEKIKRVFQFMVDHVDDFFRIAVAAAAVALALKGVALATAAVQWGVMLASLGPIGVALGVVGVALAAVAGAFFLAYTSSETFRAKVAELWKMVEERLWPILKEWGTWIKEELAPALERFANETLAKIIEGFDHFLDKVKENEEGLKALAQLMADMEPIFRFFAENVIEEFSGLVGQVVTVVGWIGRLVGAVRKIPVRKVTSYLFSPGKAISTILRVTGLTKAIPRAWSTLMRFLGGGGALGWILRITGATKRIPRSWRTAYRFLSSGAVSAIRKVIEWIRRIPRNVTTTITSITRNITESISRFIPWAHGGIVGAQGLQTGGVSGRRTALVGERGPELVELPFGSRVVPAGQTRAALDRAGQREPIVLEIRSGGSRLDDLLVDVLRKSIRARGGNVQVVLGSG